MSDGPMYDDELSPEVGSGEDFTAKQDLAAFSEEGAPPTLDVHEHQVKQEWVTKRQMLIMGAILSVGAVLMISGMVFLALYVVGIQNKDIGRNNDRIKDIARITHPTPAQYRVQLLQGFARCAREPLCKKVLIDILKGRHPTKAQVNKLRKQAGLPPVKSVRQGAALSKGKSQGRRVPVATTHLPTTHRLPQRHTGGSGGTGGQSPGGSGSGGTPPPPSNSSPAPQPQPQPPPAQRPTVVVTVPAPVTTCVDHVIGVNC